MKTILYLSIISLLLGCSYHTPIKTTDSCLQYQQELNNLKDKRQNHTLQNVTALVLGGGKLSYQEEQHLDEKIQVLEMKISECHK